jgi:hypothetical protein
MLSRWVTRFYAAIGWTVVLMNQSDPSAVLADYSVATELDPGWYQAWHTWALANFEVITQLEVSQQGLSSAHFTTYIIPAVEGQSIGPRTSRHLLATLCYPC